jgi:hypothetical protein
MMMDTGVGCLFVSPLLFRSPLHVRTKLVVYIMYIEKTPTPAHMSVENAKARGKLLLMINRSIFVPDCSRVGNAWRTWVVARTVRNPAGYILPLPAASVHRAGEPLSTSRCEHNTGRGTVSERA